MINEYTGKLVTNGLMDQNGRYGAIDPARQSAYDPALAHLSPDLLNFCLPEFRHAPIASKAANMACKIGDQPAPIGCVDHQIGRAHVCTPVTNANLVCRLLLEQKKTITNT